MQEEYLSVKEAKESDLTDAEVKAAIATATFLFSVRSQPSFRRWRTRSRLTNLNSMRRAIVTLTGCVMLQHKRKRVSIYPYVRHTTSALMPQTLTPLSPPNSYYGCDNGVWESHAMISLTEVLTRQSLLRGKLPVNTWHHYDEKSNSGTVAYPRGFGLRW